MQPFYISEMGLVSRVLSYQKAGSYSVRNVANCIVGE